MSRDDGFQIADVDTGLDADPKVVALARRLRDPLQTAAHVALFEALVRGSWRAGERITFDEALPAWWLEPADEIRANLVAVGLIGDDGRLPEHAWDAWFLPAWDRREARRKSGRKGGLSKGRSSKPQASLEPRSGVPQPDRPSGRSVPSVSSEGLSTTLGADTRARPDDVVQPHDGASGDEPEWPVLSWLASVKATIEPNGLGYHRKLIALVERQGAVKVLTAMKARHAAGDRSARQLLLGAENELEPIAPGSRPAKGNGDAEAEAEADRARRRAEATSRRNAALTKVGEDTVGKSLAELMPDLAPGIRP